MSLTIGEQIAVEGWHTGSVIPHEAVPSLVEYLARPRGDAAKVEAADWLVVSSQTCDVVAKTPEAEPLVELLHCHANITKLRSQHKNLRSTRRLDFKPNIETHPTLAVTAHATADRYVVPRELLLKTKPDCDRKLSAISARRLLEWYALRARRPAWPDAFLGRIRPAQGTFESLLDPFGDALEVRVSIVESGDELTSEQYHIAVFFVVDEQAWLGDTAQRSAIQSAFAGFVSALNGCAGISIDEEKSGVFSGAEFSWQLTRLSDEWNFANLSYSD